MSKILTLSEESIIVNNNSDWYYRSKYLNHHYHHGDISGDFLKCFYTNDSIEYGNLKLKYLGYKIFSEHIAAKYQLNLNNIIFIISIYQQTYSNKNILFCIKVQEFKESSESKDFKDSLESKVFEARVKETYLSKGNKSQTIEIIEHNSQYFNFFQIEDHILSIVYGDIRINFDSYENYNIVKNNNELKFKKSKDNIKVILTTNDYYRIFYNDKVKLDSNTITIANI